MTGGGLRGSLCGKKTKFHSKGKRHTESSERDISYSPERLMAVLRKKRNIILLGGHGRASNGSRGDRWRRLSLENALAN